MTTARKYVTVFIVDRYAMMRYTYKGEGLGSSW